MREYVFYSRNSETVKSAIDAINTEIPQYELQFYIAEDKKWVLYKQFA